MLEALNIRARIGNKEILHGIDFQAKAGEITAIVGPNGSGKSTLLKTITDEIDYSGTIRLNGRDTAAMKPWELAALRGVLPQAATLAFPFTVIEVVRMGLTTGTSGDRADVPARALAAVGLDGYAGRFYQELSGGEQQRAQLARVLCQVWQPVVDGTPRWLLLDEPVASLDIGHQLLVMELVKDYAARGGGVVAVMHDLNLSAMFATRIAMIMKGTLLVSGTPETVMQDEILSKAYDCTLRVNTPAMAGQSYLLPHLATAPHGTSGFGSA
ncbi:heme ABC transporter ATP-binding protein [Sulfitobacter sp. F26169L]|uniref:heme ABC transporter ATP-binding protein n=1 Tax=Sulfitobacter sp. F26169L TaxID=2996015 RepID=UPI002260D7C8|nr:heme ABC transporter ATP-binding protein [Sulfitobacter sp. F26169L]MCX7567318.1 heme ABC transporter ATP-binding protein [Sulfitobacter sp. F26169L]